MALPCSLSGAPCTTTCGVRRFLHVTRKSRRQKRENATVVSIFSARAEAWPDKPCFFFEDSIWTNRDVNEYSNRIAQVFHNAGLRHGDVMALCMGNRPEYVCIWLGLAKLGVISALINNNLRLQQLTYTLQVAKCRGIIYCEETAPAIDEIADSLEPSMMLYHLGKLIQGPVTKHVVTSLNPLLNAAPSTPPKMDRQPCYSDKLLYIYTSGTTGLPKAAVIPHSRFLFATTGLMGALDIRPEDVIYTPLPLYHTAGGVLGVGTALAGGTTVVIAKKFSASNYWKDCIKYNCTVGQYIGEICRYILAVSPSPEDRQHSVRCLYGNGMRPAIWDQFVKRFNIPLISELYGATEGNATLTSVDNRIGAVGFIPRLAPWSVLGLALIRMDPDTDKPLRDSNGLCIKCDVGEPGMFVGVISTKNVTREFHGYIDREESEKKVVQNVFKIGDKAFLSGDILVMDEYGYMYFKDRTGDTFRWKGENVSTAEVEAVIMDIIGLRDATVYGVEIPGIEGRAGMLAVVDVDDSLDLDALASGLDRMLAYFARPLFVRVVTSIDRTGTYKMRKVELQAEGCNPCNVKDKLYLRRGTRFLPFDKDLYEDILAERVRI